MYDPTYKEIAELMHRHEKGLIEEIARKHGWSVSETKRRLGEIALKDYVDTVIKKAIGEPYKEIPSLIRGELRLITMKLVLPIFWATVRYLNDIPKLNQLLEATPVKIFEEIKKAYETLRREAREIA